MPPKKHARTPSEPSDYTSHPELKRPSTKRAKEIDHDPPYEQLVSLVDSNDSSAEPKNVLHWFRSKDLRLEDNRALHAASQKVQEGNGNLICVYLHSPKDLEWHGTSPARLDFILETLRKMKEELEKVNVPLHVATVESRAHKTNTILDFAETWDVTHIYANMEYEVDELRRDIDLANAVVKNDYYDISFEVVHDQTVVIPATLVTGAGGPHKVFTPYHKVWLSETKSEPELFEDLVPKPEGNDAKAKEELKSLFGGKMPGLPEGKSFEKYEEDRERLRKLWPAGHDAGMKRLDEFLEKKVKTYAAHRSEPALDPSSRLSPYFASGVVSVREVLKRTKEFNKGKHFDDGDRGIASWVREIVFREFYRHIMVVIPHNSMNLPQNLKFDFVEWEEDEEGYKKWEEGTTGMPFIDAGMRQLNHEAYMHNRLRMNTSSYLRANMLIDYRRGERYFAETLIDWDLSNNTQGWEPSYTIFNPVVQAEKCDPNGDYIRKWVPELKDVKGKAVFDPYNRLSKSEFEKLGYPAPHVDFKESQQRAKERYKRDLAEA
ncbi:hypothetical protein DOTSEDRAFT_160926, partial [Dothistroma septosporum NZE10]